MTRSIVVLLVLAAAALVPPAHAGWNPDGVTIKPTTDRLPRVAACSDGLSGAFVVWQQDSSSNTGVLRLQHLLATGDLDPAWPSDGVIACSVRAARNALGALADGQGGVYLWWMEGAVVFVKRVLVNGQTAGGWAERGSVRATLDGSNRRPSVISDGGSGIYLGCALGEFVRVLHLGPNNTGPSSVARAPAGMTYVVWPQLALADDGGVFVAWAHQSLDDPEVTSAWALTRLLPTMTTAPGWPAGGIDVAPSHLAELVDPFPLNGNYPGASMIALSPDANGGVFLWIEDGVQGEAVEYRLRRLQGDGSPAPGWPAAGVSVDSYGGYYFGDLGPDLSLRVLPGDGGAFIGAPPYDYHSTGGVSVMRCSAAGPGEWIGGSSVAGLINGIIVPELELLPNGSGGIFLSNCVPWGPYQEYDPYARIQLVQRPAPAGWTDWGRIHWEPPAGGEWYGDVALAEAGPGAVILFWSQRHERFGLFARRFSSTGEVTAVDEPPSSELALGAPWPNPGRPGVEASIPVRLMSEGEVAVALVDVTGREIARRSPERLGAGAHVVRWDPGPVAPGVYFLRMEVSGVSTATSRRWVVLR